MSKILQYIIFFFLISLSHLKFNKRSYNLRIMTFNIHYGTTIDNIFDIEAIAQDIKKSNADIVCLQEVAQNWDSSSQYKDLIKIISEITGMEYHYCPIYNKTSSRGPEYPREMFGVAILSKYKISEKYNHIISRWSSQKGDPQPGEPGFPSQFPGFGQIIIDLGDDRRFQVYNTHLDYRAEIPKGLNTTMRAIQVKEMLRIMQLDKYPTVLTGDFNANKEAKDVFDPLLNVLDDKWDVKSKGQGYTFDCRNPSNRIDYIFINRGFNIEVKDMMLINTQTSDHLPVVYDLVVTYDK